ncbi:hypothetical protein [Thioalkalivibrio sp.]|uniref:hypothetical protein n=1 Tax=Thioalkalivibrio sp. TaxID=2093813 RepID=UPI0035621C10
MKVQALIQTLHAVEETVYALVPELIHELFRAGSEILDFLQGTGTFSDDVPLFDQVLELLWQLPEEFSLCRTDCFGRGDVLIHVASQTAANTVSCAKRGLSRRYRWSRGRRESPSHGP